MNKIKECLECALFVVMLCGLLWSLKHAAIIDQLIISLR
jgi:hypothetical protein